MKLKIYIDGASRGNPGLGAAGVVIMDTHGAVIAETGKFLGSCTNNFAEYSAFSLAFSLAKKAGGTELQIFSDSELLVRQFNGIYRIKNPNLASFMAEIRKKTSSFKAVTLGHIPRELNARADMQANIALDRGSGKVRRKKGGDSGKPSQLSFF
ncbi:MAG: ribonuclease HI family protein [bacterium]